jgi:hypothetical protein
MDSAKLSKNEENFEYFEQYYDKLEKMHKDDQIIDCINLVKDIGKKIILKSLFTH